MHDVSLRSLIESRTAAEPAFVFGGTPVSRAEFAERIEQTTAWLAAQNIGNLHSQTAKNGTVSIDDVPLALVQIHFRQMRFHDFPIKRETEIIKRPTQVNKLFFDLRRAAARKSGHSYRRF